MSVPIISELDNKFLPYRDRVSFAYGWTLFLGFLVFLATQSIQFGSTDLWYHLHGGRHLFEHGTFYDPLFDSYLEAEGRSGVNYFWGFQALVYLVWSLTGEFGLVLLKAIGLSAAGYFAMKTVLQSRRLSDATFLQLVVITAVVGLLASRGYSLRPHVASYILIAVFTYILSSREKSYPLLPLLTVIWVNFHGIEYVVGALICGAFFLQRLLDWFENGRPREGVMPLVWISLCAPAMLLNPFGYHLISAPFLHSPDLHLFIGELQSYELELVVDLQQGLSINTLVLIIMGLALYSALVCLSDYRKHIAVIILAIGGMILLLRAHRFLWEWALLTLPMISAALTHEKGIKHSVVTTAMLAIGLVGLTMTFLPNMKHGLQYYPYDKNSLPAGTTEFIKAKGISGRYALEPSYAGYAEFILSPGVKMHMDMQFPPFTSADYHQLVSAMANESGLRSYVARYQPDMFGVRKSDAVFPAQVAASLGYFPVFFDRQVVLYLNRERHKDLVDEFALKAVNPFNPSEIRVDQVEQAITELQRMQQVIDVPEIKQTLLNLLVTTGDLIPAQVLRNELLVEDPHHPTTLFLSARVDHLSGNCPGAVEGYRKAIAATVDDPTPMRLLSAECYFVMRDLNSAYEQFSLALNPYADLNPNKLQYYQFALSAIGVGNSLHAAQLLDMLENIDPEGEYSARIAEVRSALSQG